MTELVKVEVKNGEQLVQESYMSFWKLVANLTIGLKECVNTDLLKTRTL